jgi:uncharacterized protein YndB with AHSA1/START domain
MTKKRLTLERTYRAPIADVWELWTTKDGIESWWGPDGFDVTVQSIDLRVGGELRYTMNARRPEMIAFMTQNKMPTSTAHKLTYTEILTNKRLRYRQLADFIPEVAPYDVDTVVELDETAAGVKMTITFDAMHDEMWTKRAVMGRESELDKLEKLLTKP